MPESMRVEINKLFTLLDEDGDGNVTFTEAMKYWSEGSFSKLNVRAMFNEVDEDHNGEISHDEWMKFWLQVLTCGYTPDDVHVEIEEMLNHNTWVDWLDGRNVQTDEKSILPPVKSPNK